jgi:Creatinase/Prolidase N-terminal domain
MSWCPCLAATLWMPSGQTARRRQWWVAAAPAAYEHCTRYLAGTGDIDGLVCAVQQAKTRVHPTKLAGVSVQDKLKLVREDLKGAFTARSALTPGLIMSSTQWSPWCASTAISSLGEHVATNPCPTATEQKVGALIVTALDEVAWLLNLRGGDVAYNPIFISYVIVTPDTATLYVDSAKVCCCASMTCLHTPLMTCQ